MSYVAILLEHKN